MTYDFIELEKNGTLPLYQKLYNCISKAVEQGRLPQGTKLPSIRKLSEDLSVSRTTVESAYSQLDVEGYIVSRPQSGFYVQTSSMPLSAKKAVGPSSGHSNAPMIRYDLGSGTIDRESADLKLWRSYVKDILKQETAITSYGEPQGEYELRKSLSLYSYAIRGVICNPDNIIIGAGTQPILYILCGLLRSFGNTVAIEKGGFARAEQVFTDCGYNIIYIPSDDEGIDISFLYDSDIKILFVNPSQSLLNGQPLKMNKRYEILKWAEKCSGIIIEDDYNGEIRFSSRPIPALQGNDSERVIYAGSFSKLLLPSVRIGYAVLPESLLSAYTEKSSLYNQTASKIEQLALAKYIHDGRLDRRLRRQRKIYLEKLNALISALKNRFGSDCEIVTFENSLCLHIFLPRTDKDIAALAAKKGLRITHIPTESEKCVLRLGFAGIPLDDIEPAAEILKEIYYK